MGLSARWKGVVKLYWKVGGSWINANLRGHWVHLRGCGLIHKGKKHMFINVFLVLLFL